ncbi:DoxX family membrane protein [Knoellia subterranea]|uniref:Membrane protein n=1 Tax=Knoellia subterranea KCTC 19937 TaxID=1385521 RepID=A0A0A0JPB0_9MICO|nr:DoxX family membrane protein [Knoellia subterranea]KGN38574.1 membrane protein [Knoellia subterranea KCTC 19937]
MSSTVRIRDNVKGPHATAPATPEADVKGSSAFTWFAGLTRIALGWVFLWAFLDKLLALGFSTGRNPETGVVDRFGSAAWIHEGSPTEGFLKFGTKGPLADFYQSFAGATWANWLFMIGLAGIGIALTLGVATRIASVSGALMLVLMWSATLLPENNPIIDDHIVYALVLGMLATVSAGRYLGLGRWWESLPIVQRNAALK